jgi:uncharacterized Ntn-hydrolase superfamily protein
MFSRMFVVFAVAFAMLGFAATSAEATWSVIAVDETTGEVGVAVASCVGFEVTVVPILVSGVGAGASQANISRPSGQRMVDALVDGASAQETIDTVVDADDGMEERQFGVVVLGDAGAGWTGGDTIDVAIDRRSENGTVAAQGNILVSEDVVDAAIAGFGSAEGELADRLIAGLVAGADAGGDARCGDQTATSAALVVARPGDPDYAYTDTTPLGPDPAVDLVPSVFVSVLVEKGGERAPDELAEVWAAADQDAPSVVIRQIDPGADTAAQGSPTIVVVFLGIAFLIGIVVAGALILTRNKAARGNS